MPIRCGNVQPRRLGTYERVTEHEQFTIRGGWNGQKAKKWPSVVSESVKGGKRRNGVKSVECRANETKQLPLLYPSKNEYHYSKQAGNSPRHAKKMAIFAKTWGNDDVGQSRQIRRVM